MSDDQPGWRRGPDGTTFRQKKDGSWWWQATDQQWYREDQHPNYRPPAPPPPPPPAPPAPPDPGSGGPLLEVKSHDEDRNATVTLYPDRIERVLDRKRLSVSRAKQDSEVIPMRAVSSVQAKKDGLTYTKVTVFASGNTIEFRLRHDDAQRFKNAITAEVLRR